MKWKCGSKGSRTQWTSERARSLVRPERRTTRSPWTSCHRMTLHDFRMMKAINVKAMFVFLIFYSRKTLKELRRAPFTSPHPPSPSHAPPRASPSPCHPPFEWRARARTHTTPSNPKESYHSPPLPSSPSLSSPFLFLSSPFFFCQPMGVNCLKSPLPVPYCSFIRSRSSISSSSKEKN